MARSCRLGLAASLVGACLCAWCPRSPWHGAAFLVPRRSHIVTDQQGRGQRSPAVPCRHRASKSGCVEEPKESPPPGLLLPEANYFTTVAAAHCIEDGCPLEEAEDICRRLETDEPRIQATIERLSGVPSDSGKAEEIQWLQGFLDQSREMREKLHEVMSAEYPDAAQAVMGHLAFGSGLTGGFLTLRTRPIVF